MLYLGHYIMCDGCYTIVSGGFGSIENAAHVFHCMDCSQKLAEEATAEENLKIASSYDPTKQEII